MSRKTIQVSEELHSQLKLRSVQDGVPIPDVIANLMKEPIPSPSITKETQTAQEASDEVIIVKIPEELLFKLKEAGCSEELTVAEYEIRPSHGGIEVSYEHGRISAGSEYCKADAAPEVKRRYLLEDIIDHAQMDLLEKKAKHIIKAFQKQLEKYPAPEERAMLKRHIEELKKCRGNYTELKSKVLEIDPDWREFEFDLDEIEASNRHKGWICYLP